MRIAVFSKNHLAHLKAAASIAAADSEQRVTFRSSQRWAEAYRMLQAKGPIPIVFAVNGSGPQVRFKAILQEIVLRPTANDARCKELLELRPPTTRNEPFWDKDPKTLYVISGCSEIRPIPYARLLKANNREPLSNDFGYSYALVLTPGADPGAAAKAHDNASPPARMQATIERVVRDTALTRRLKTLHDHTCQLCGFRLTLADGSGYSEAHHMKPLGRPHNGPDIARNVLVLCPNCHALCDYCSVILNEASLRLVKGHAIDKVFLLYHNELGGASNNKRTIGVAT